MTFEYAEAQDLSGKHMDEDIAFHWRNEIGLDFAVMGVLREIHHDQSGVWVHISGRDYDDDIGFDHVDPSAGNDKKEYCLRRWDTVVLKKGKPDLLGLGAEALSTGARKPPPK